MSVLYLVPCSKCGVEYGPMSADKVKRNTPFVCAVCRDKRAGEEATDGH